MAFLSDLWYSIANPLKRMRVPENGLGVAPAVAVMAAACAVNAVAAPIAYALGGRGDYVLEYTVGGRLLVLLASAASMLIATVLFQLIAALFRRPVGFRRVLATWGVSFAPTLLCVAAVEASESWFYAFMVTPWLSVLLCTLLVLLLAWKAILYFMELNVVLGLKGGQVAGAMIITAAVYAALIFAGFRLGMKVPML